MRLTDSRGARGLAIPLRRVAWTALLFCTPGAATSQVARDSAGVRIIENDAPRWTAASRWRLSARPILSIGTNGGDSLYEFSRVNGLVRMSDGRIAVLNDGSHQLRFYSADGKFLSASGRSGSGPGEFRQIMGLHRFVGDSLFIIDFGKAHVFAPDGKFVRLASQMNPGFKFGYPSVVFEDGSFLTMASSIEVVSQRLGERKPAPTPATGEWMDSVSVIWIARDGQRAHEIARIPMRVIYASARSREGLSKTFEPYTQLAGRGDRLYTARADKYEIRAYRREPPAADGSSAKSVALTSIIRRRVDRVPVSSELKDEYKRRFLTRPGEDGRPAPPDLRGHWQRMADEMQFVDQLPAFSKLKVDRRGNLWVRSYNVKEDMPGTRSGPVRQYSFPWPTDWDVFDPNGSWLGTLTLPSRFEPLDIGDDYLLGLSHDDDDVEYVKMYRLSKP